MTSVTTLETFTSPMMYNTAATTIVTSIPNKDSGDEHYREMHDEGIVFNDEMAYSENEEEEDEEEMSPLEGAANENEFYEEDEEYYVEALPEANAGPSGFRSNVNSSNAVIAASVTMGRNNPPGGEPVKKRRRRRTVPPEVKKDNHKERERARRNLIKDRFAYLRATIPTLGENAHKMARTEVLDHVIDYIQFMRNRNQNHMIEIENLRVSNVNIEEQTKGLAMALKCGYRLGGYMEPNNGEIVIDGVLPDSSATVLLDGVPVSAFEVDSQSSNVDSAIIEPNPIIDTPLPPKLKSAAQRPVDNFHTNHGLVQQHPIDEFYEQGGFENHHSITSQQEHPQYHSHITESSVVISSGSVNEFSCPPSEENSNQQSQSVAQTQTADAIAVIREPPPPPQPSAATGPKVENSPDDMVLQQSEVQQSARPNTACDDAVRTTQPVSSSQQNQMYHHHHQLQQSATTESPPPVLIPTVVVVNEETTTTNAPSVATTSTITQAEALAPQPPHRGTQLDLDVFGYESPEEELIMLSELKDEMAAALNEKKQKPTKPRKPRTSKKQPEPETPNTETNTPVEKPLPRPRGRPKKTKAPETIEEASHSACEVRHGKKPEAKGVSSVPIKRAAAPPEDNNSKVMIGGNDSKSKMAPKRRKSSRLSESTSMQQH